MASRFHKFPPKKEEKKTEEQKRVGNAKAEMGNVQSKDDIRQVALGSSASGKMGDATTTEGSILQVVISSDGSSQQFTNSLERMINGPSASTKKNRP